MRQLLSICLLLIAAVAGAASLQWDASENATGYKIYYGTTSGQYQFNIDAGNVLTWGIPNDWPAGIYYFTATAYNANGESGYSNEVQWIKAETPSIQPASGGQWQLAWIGDSVMAAPTYVNQYATAFNSATTPKTAMNAVAINSGDVLISFICSEGSSAEGGSTENGSATLSLLQEIDITDYTETKAWSYTATGNENLTLTYTSDGAIYFGGNVIRFSNSNGVGASQKANGSSGSPSVSLTTTQDNSAIVAICGDWNAVSGTQTFTLGGSSSGWVALTDYPGDSAHYGVAIAYHPDVGTAGSKTIAMSAPSGQKWAIIVVEVKGTAGGGASVVPVLMRQYRARR